jgi:HrpA-like RNA helicase
MVMVGETGSGKTTQFVLDLLLPCLCLLAVLQDAIGYPGRGIT